MTEGASNLGLTAENIPVTQENILAALRSGTPLICSMYPGDFTYTGHFIVLTGIDENGAITVNDPNMFHPHPRRVQQNSASISEPSGIALLDTIKSHKSSHAVPFANG